MCPLDNLNWTSSSHFKCLIAPPANASSLLYAFPIVVTVVDFLDRSQNQTVIPSQTKFSRFTWRTGALCLHSAVGD